LTVIAKEPSLLHVSDCFSFSTADELQIDLQANDIQRVHRQEQKERNKENARPTIARFV